MKNTTTAAAPGPSSTGQMGTNDRPPHVLLWELSTMAVVARCLHAVAHHGVADSLALDGATLEDLADRLGLDTDGLGRVLRVLDSHGVFEVDLPMVRHTEASLLLRSDHPMSMGAFAHMMGLPLSWDALRALPHTLETGRAGIFDLDPSGLFSYLRDHPDQAMVFDHAMTAKSHADIPLVLDVFDFGTRSSVADVGGGRGHLLNALADRHCDLEVTLVDLPEVIERVTHGSGNERVRLVAADFFTDTLPVADVYVLMEIIHDWDDNDAVRILANIRRSAPDDATLVIIETVLGGRSGPDPATTLDIVMMAVTGGRERTPAQFSCLFEQSGFELVGVIPTGGGVQLVEARAMGKAFD